MFYKKEEGAALVLVLVLLLVGTVLVTALASTVSNHINIAIHKEGMSKAFHYAESGVEFMRANKDDEVFKNIENGVNYYVSFDKAADEIEINEYENEKEIEAITDDLNFNNAENIEFKITISENSNDYEVISEGIYESNSDNNYTQKITFDIISSGGSFNKTFNVKHDYNPDNDHNSNLLKKIISQSASTFYPEKMTINKDIDPDWEFWESLGKENENKEENKNEKIIYHDSFTTKKVTPTWIDSIIIINGDLTVNPGSDFENSIIVVNGSITINGSPARKLTNSVFFAYGNDVKKNKPILKINGNPKSWGTDLDFDKLPEVLTEKTNANKNDNEITNWNQL